MIIFLYGPNTFLAQQKINELKLKFFKEVDPGGDSLIIFDGASLELPALINANNTGSLFARKRMVIIKDCLSNKRANFLADLAAYLKNLTPSQDNIILFYEPLLLAKTKSSWLLDNGDKGKVLLKAQTELVNFLNQQKLTQNFAAFNETEAAKWLEKKAAAFQVKFDFRSLRALIAAVGLDLWRLNQETDKLIHFCLGRNAQPIITVEDVNLLVSNETEENVFALTDALGSGNKSAAAKILSDQLDNNHAIYLLAMIGAYFKNLLKIRQALDNGTASQKISGELKLHPFVVQKGINQLRHFNLVKLKNLTNDLQQLEWKIKTGQSDSGALLQWLAGS